MVSFSEKQLLRKANGAFPSRAFGEAAAPPNRALMLLHRPINSKFSI